MNTFYFNKHEFLQILKIVTSNPYKAKELYEKYLDKYPEDYGTYSYYISTLITLNEIDKASEVLKYMNKLLFKNCSYLSKTERIEKFQKIYYYTKLKLLMYQNKYQEAYDLCMNFFPYIDLDIQKIIFYLECKLGINKKLVRKDLNYAIRQILEYDEEDFFYHIRKHLADFNQNLDEPNKFVFTPSFNIEKIIKEFKKYIPSDKRLLDGFFEDSYIFKYDECGRVNNKLVNYFKVVCYHDTTNCITMCPSIEGEYLPYVDLNYLKEKEAIKVKKISQVDKFYKRYQKR